MPLTDRMPTAGKLCSAAGIGAVGWFGSGEIVPLLPDGTDLGWFYEVNVLLGVLCGWVVTGSRLGRGYANAISAAVTGTASLFFWALFCQSMNEMLRLAVERRFDGLLEALLATFQVAFDFLVLLMHAPLIAVLFGGAVITGLISEFALRRMF